MSLGKKKILSQAAAADLTLYKTVLYSGNGGTKAVTGVGFKPDFVWIKSTNNTGRHLLTDVVRGTASQLFTNETLAAQNDLEFTSFDTDGFTLTFDSGSQNFNNSGTDYVAWCWKAGGTAITGSGSNLTSISRSTNTGVGGFSIVQYTSSGTSGATFAHGLGATPDIVLIKSTSTASTNWIMSITNVVSNQYLLVNDQGIGGTGGFAVDGTNVTLNNTLGDANTSGRTYIAYCWASVTEFSKVGTFVGTGTTTGNIVTVGFEPAFLLVKSTTLAGSNWILLDKARTPSNPMENDLNPNLNNAQQGGTGSNFPQATTTSTTFQCNSTDGSINRSGETYLYMVFK